MTLPASGRSPLRIAVLAAATVAIGLTAGCAGGGKAKKDVAYVARDVDTLYMTAKDRLDNGDAKPPPPCSTKWSASTPIRPGPAARS
jgi:outer membrane protein assembly factor BamD